MYNRDVDTLWNQRDNTVAKIRLVLFDNAMFDQLIDDMREIIYTILRKRMSTGECTAISEHLHKPVGDAST